ncbi:hypothetical protein AE937_11620 [Bacteroides fragilis]|uniref:Uncharacterized protein n=1 Tax=Bacteroides fragilis TaxID=817 RepID=A0A413JT00_BACFG|nr:hypothetical protein [Bacteroides fragilis]RGY65022.1 hypothetical protein DXA27_20695 [Bacteroides fragilis]
MKKQRKECKYVAHLEYSSFFIRSGASYTLFPYKELTPICKHRHQKDTESQNSLTSPFHIRVKAEETEHSKKLFLQEIRAFGTEEV